MRRSFGRLWIVWETKKIPQLGDWRKSEMQTEGISDTIHLMSGCTDWESIVSSSVFNSNHCHHMKNTFLCIFNPSFISRKKSNRWVEFFFLNQTGLFLTLRHLFPFYFSMFVLNTFTYISLYFPENSGGFFCGQTSAMTHGIVIISLHKKQRSVRQQCIYRSEAAPSSLPNPWGAAAERGHKLILGWARTKHSSSAQHASPRFQPSP